MQRKYNIRSLKNAVFKAGKSAAAAAGYVASNRATYQKEAQKWIELGQMAQQVLQGTKGGKKRPSSNSYTQTATKRQKRSSRSGASNSTSSGFVKPGTKRKVTETLYATKGVVQSYERGAVYSGVVTPGVGAEQVIYLGHATASPDQIRVHLWRAFVKFFANRLGYTVTSVQDKPLAGSTGGRRMTWEILYKQTPTSVTSTTGFVLTDTMSWDTFAGLFRTTFTSSNLQLQTMKVYELDTSAGAYALPIASFNLTKAKINIYAKSSFKVQNRTINTEGDNEGDDVDNVPLYGKSYEGSGNGAVYMKDGCSTGTFLANSQGIINPHPISIDSEFNDLNEPPNYKQFTFVKKHGKIHLDPGHIKTSVLTYKKGFNMMNLMKILNDGASVTSVPRVSIGNYRFFAMEKMVQAVATTTTNAPKIAYEIDWKLGIYVTCPKSQITTYIIDVAPK